MFGIFQVRSSFSRHDGVQRCDSRFQPPERTRFYWSLACDKDNIEMWYDYPSKCTDLLHKWRLNLYNNTLYIISLSYWCFQTKGFSHECEAKDVSVQAPFMQRSIALLRYEETIQAWNKPKTTKTKWFAHVSLNISRTFCLSTFFHFSELLRHFFP